MVMTGIGAICPKQHYATSTAQMYRTLIMIQTD